LYLQAKQKIRQFYVQQQQQEPPRFESSKDAKVSKAEKAIEGLVSVL
jgi:hypothetical protein